MYNEIDKIYNEMLKRCGINYTGDTFEEDNINILEKHEITPECNYEQSGYGSGVKFERIRRCTGYLSGDYKTRFNDAKRAEVEDRTNSNKYTRTESYHERWNKIWTETEENNEDAWKTFCLFRI